MSKKQYCYDYPRPSLTADCVIFNYDAESLEVLLIKRKHEPFEGKWAFPGGFVDENEPVEDAAERELQEETGLSGLDLIEFGTYTAPGRDPRGRTVSVAFWALGDNLKSQAQAGDDAADVSWFSVDNIPEPAFDHDEMFIEAVFALKAEIEDYLQNIETEDKNEELYFVNLLAIVNKQVEKILTEIGQ